MPSGRGLGTDGTLSLPRHLEAVGRLSGTGRGLFAGGQLSPMASSVSVRELREFYAAGFAQIQKKFDADGDGAAAIVEGTALVDELVLRLYRGFFSEDTANPAGTCVVALGGYGRRTLFPYSDVDLLFLHQDSAAAEPMKEPTAELCRALLGSALAVGADHSRALGSRPVRSGHAAFSISLLDARLLAGDPRLYAKLHDVVVPKAVARERRDLIGGLEELTERRHAKFGRTIFIESPTSRKCPAASAISTFPRWLVIIS